MTDFTCCEVVKSWWFQLGLKISGRKSASSTIPRRVLERFRRNFTYAHSSFGFMLRVSLGNPEATDELGNLIN